MIMRDKIIRIMGDIFWKTDPSLCWWKGDLTMKERFIRMIKQLDAWVMDLLFPELDDDQYSDLDKFL